MSDTAADIDPDATPEASDEPKLDDLLAEFEQAQQADPDLHLPTSPEHPTKSVQPDDDEAARREFEERAGALLDSFEEKARQDREAEDVAEIDTAVSRAAKSLGDLDFADDIARSFLFSRSQTDPRFMEAFQNRREDPRGWQAQLSKAMTDMDAKYSQRIDRNATEDREAVTYAVRGTAHVPSQEEMDDAEYRAVPHMSDAQFEKWQNDRFGNG